MNYPFVALIILGLIWFLYKPVEVELPVGGAEEVKEIQVESVPVQDIMMI